LAELTLAYLESLSTGELIELAAGNGVDIPPGLERAFIIEELLYLNHDLADKGKETEETEFCDINQFAQFMVLPQQHHVTFVDVLIRDPLWAFVFWEIKAHDRSVHENADDFKGYCLRVIPLNEDSLQPDEAASFIVTVDTEDSARYLGFSPEDGRCFKVELCMLNREDRVALAESQPFCLPRLIKPKPDEDLQAVYRNPLAQLSGIDRFSLVHSEDRPLRSRDSKG